MKETSLLPFGRWGNWGSRKLSWSRSHHLENGRTRTQKRTSEGEISACFPITQLPPIKIFAEALISVPTTLGSALSHLSSLYRVTHSCSKHVHTLSSLRCTRPRELFTKFCCEGIQRNRAVAGEKDLGRGKGDIFEGGRYLSRCMCSRELPRERGGWCRRKREEARGDESQSGSRDWFLKGIKVSFCATAKGKKTKLR